MVCSRLGHEAVLAELLKSGAHGGAADEFRDTAMNRAARSGQAGIIKQLVVHGESVNVTDAEVGPVLSALLCAEVVGGATRL